MAWQRWDGEHHGKCINLNAFGWFSSLFNILLEAIIIYLPFSRLRGLRMTQGKRYIIGLMLVSGGGL
jgi:hypothetical protein